MAEAYANLFAKLHLQIDQSEVKTGTERALKAADGKTAGRAVGKTYGAAVSAETISEVRGAAGKLISRTDARREGEAAGRALGEGAKTTAAREGAQAGHKFGTEFKEKAREPLAGIKTLMLGAVAGLGGIELFKNIIEEGEEAEKGARLTAAAIKSTGGAAKVSLEDIDRLTASLGRTAGVDDDVIRAGTNMLLTFKGIRNEAGKNNDVFSQAAKATLDMTAAMNGGNVTQEALRKNSILVGKALNDPVKGMSALRRVGVTLDEQQQKTVKSLVAQGRTMDAQKIILRELGTEFGGAAAASATPMARLHAVVQQLEEEAGKRLLPVLGAMATKLMALVEWLSGNSEKAHALRAAFNTLVDVVKNVGVWVGHLVVWLSGNSTAAKLLSSLLLGLAAAFGALFVINKVAGYVKAARAAWVALNATFALSPVGLIIIAVVALAAALYLAWTRSATFRKIVEGAFRAVQAAAQAVWDWLKANWPLLLAILAGPIGVAAYLIWKHWARIMADARAVLDWFRHYFGSNVADFFTKVIPGIWDRAVALARTRIWDPLKHGFDVFWHWLYETFYGNEVRLFTVTIPGLWDRAVALTRARILTPLHDAFFAFWHWLYQVFYANEVRLFTVTIPALWDRAVALTKARVLTPLHDGFFALWHWLYQVFYANEVRLFTVTIPALWDRAMTLVRSRLWDPLKNGFNVLWGWLYNTFYGNWVRLFTQTIPHAIDVGVQGISRFWSKVQSVLKGPANFMIGSVYDNGIRKFWNFVVDHIGLKSIELPFVATLARGGIVPGLVPGLGDRQPALLERDETVVSREHSRLGFMRAAFERAGVPGYQRGGQVSAAQARFGSSVAPTGGNIITRGIGGAAGAVVHAVAGAVHKALDFVKIGAALASNNSKALTNAMTDLIGKGAGGAAGDLARMVAGMPATLLGKVASKLISLFASTGGADLAGISSYAESFKGKVPYAWGGQTPSGWDCSGFVSYVLQHFKLLGARMVASGLQSWSKPSGPVPGAMAFYGKPYHVGFVVNGNTLLSALHTGTNTVESALGMGDNSGYGIPPGGLGFGGRVPNIGSGVRRWLPTVLQALSMEGLPGSLANLILAQMQSESGGNPNSINTTDINAQRGDPSRGLLQTIMATFTRWHWPGTSWNIYDPLANVAAAINYSHHGRGFGTAPGQMGSMHGYAGEGRSMSRSAGSGC